jgi:hypothetical protein
VKFVGVDYDDNMEKLNNSISNGAVPFKSTSGFVSGSTSKFGDRMGERVDGSASNNSMGYMVESVRSTSVYVKASGRELSAYEHVAEIAPGTKSGGNRTKPEALIDGRDFYRCAIMIYSFWSRHLLLVCHGVWCICLLY